MSRVVGLAFLLAACARSPGPASTSGATGSPLESPEKSPATGATDQTLLVANAPLNLGFAEDERWVESVRAGDFRDAARRLDALPNDRAAEPAIRYVRARVGMTLNDYERSRGLLEGLEKALPFLATEIARDRAECALEVGPYEEAAHYFSARGDAESVVKAGIAFERGKELSRARMAAERALRLLGKNDDPRAFGTRVRARALRSRVAEAVRDEATAATDLRWLAIEAPDSEAGRSAVEHLAALSPPRRLTPAQELLRAKKLAEAGHLDEALAAIDAAAARPDGSLEKASVVRARGYACYTSRCDYRKAAALLEESAKLDPKDAARDSFFSARALSRAQDDETAISRYEELVRKYPTSSFAEEARYQAARLRMLLGKWDEAVKSYRAYLGGRSKAHPARFAAAARYELGLALLASKHGQEAASVFKALADGENDALDRAALHELEGAALAEAGDREQAVSKLGAVIRERPLSFAALSGAARLALLGAPVPPAVEEAAEARVGAKLSVELPAKAMFFRKLGLDQDAEREILAHEPEIVARYAPRGYEALCEAYGTLGTGAARYRIGQTAVKSAALEHAPTDATRWAWECVYPTPFGEIVRSAESLRGLPAGLLHAVMRQESAFRADAVSPASAVGLLQLIPSTAGKVAEELGLAMDPSLLRTPSYNVNLGAFYLHKVLGYFGGDVALAAAAYNAGPRAVSRWLETGENLPLDVWVARIPFAETRGYVARVVGNLARYSYLQGGETAVPKISLVLPKGVRAGPDDY